MNDFRTARDFLLAHRTDYEAARAGFRWPDPVAFNWALDWFDAHLARDPETRDQAALRIVDPQGCTDSYYSFADLSERSSRTANHLRSLGLVRGDRLLLLLGNEVALWETMLGAFKLGVVVIPATVLLTPEELRDRIERGAVRAVVTDASQAPKLDAAGFEGIRILCGAAPLAGWARLADRDGCDSRFEPDGPTGPDDPLLLYFTSGTTAKPKLVLHTHRSYPVGSLSTMYWLGLRPGDRHLNVSSPGWAKHAWSSFFAPWNACATVVIVNQPRFDARALLGQLSVLEITTLCAPPTVWRHLVQEDLDAVPQTLREVCGAGEPLNPEVIERVRDAWGLTIRDGYGQTETTAQIANTPGSAGIPGSMGRPLPGYEIELLDADGRPAPEGEVCLRLTGERPAGLMAGYLRDGGVLAGADGDYYHTGDVAFRDAAGSVTFVGRADDVFKSSDYRISPFELESVLVEHEAVREAAVVPLPDALRLAVPRAFVALAADRVADLATARSIFEHAAQRLAPFKRIRDIVFVTELPKTVSGKIRRVELRKQDGGRLPGDGTVLAHFTEKDVAPA
ncbi:AMP-binding protein [Aureimonas pseudogalii]|uniref:Acetyl-CoA synthetase n=1 Tax=Aureimonas pseudogalii TaxID=1744844 RepID=A0A7W6EB23_9HYPH|nr:AMP-binding protein [Aureimonas pseudogalii]MBB3998063.1 acetyl-CoA synthetase [Aureimonas pseudogalii]